MAPRQDPLDPTDRPAACADPALLTVLPDYDLDLLNDCEESVLSTSPSLPDTDADGLPDALEFYAGTVPTSSDRLLDFDADGVVNAEEVAKHTNPRANDGVFAAIHGYRTRITLEGSRMVATMDYSTALPGVEFQAASENVVGGQAYLHWDACARELSWSDARRTLPSPYLPVPVSIDRNGVYRLTAEMRRADGVLIDSIWADLEVSLELMPSCEQSPEVVGSPLISVSERTCYDVSFGNIKLMPTRASNGSTRDGENSILVFFAQAAEDNLSSPGITKIAEVKARLRCNDPNDIDTCVRQPANGRIELYDSDFVSVAP